MPRDLPPYQRGPPLSYMERMAEKRNLEEVILTVQQIKCCKRLTQKNKLYFLHSKCKKKT